MIVIIMFNILLIFNINKILFAIEQCNIYKRICIYYNKNLLFVDYYSKTVMK